DATHFSSAGPLRRRLHRRGGRSHPPALWNPTIILGARPADLSHMTETAADDIIELELMLNRFRRLIAELIKGTVARYSFQPWEVAILLDFETCRIEPKRRLETLRQYAKAVEKQLQSGPGPPMKFSEFLQLKMTRRPTKL